MTLKARMETAREAYNGTGDADIDQCLMSKRSVEQVPTVLRRRGPSRPFAVFGAVAALVLSVVMAVGIFPRSADDTVIVAEQGEQRPEDDSGVTVTPPGPYAHGDMVTLSWARPVDVAGPVDVRLCAVWTPPGLDVGHQLVCDPLALVVEGTQRPTSVLARIRSSLPSVDGSIECAETGSSCYLAVSAGAELFELVPIVATGAPGTNEALVLRPDGDASTLTIVGPDGPVDVGPSSGGPVTLDACVLRGVDVDPERIDEVGPEVLGPPCVAEVVVGAVGAPPAPKQANIDWDTAGGPGFRSCLVDLCVLRLTRWVPVDRPSNEPGAVARPQVREPIAPLLVPASRVAEAATIDLSELQAALELGHTEAGGQ